MNLKKISEILEHLEIPHGHGLSLKKGVSDGLLDKEASKFDLPNGHNESYRKGVEFGKKLKEEIAKKVKD